MKRSNFLYIIFDTLGLHKFLLINQLINLFMYLSKKIVLIYSVIYLTTYLFT